MQRLLGDGAVKPGVQNVDGLGSVVEVSGVIYDYAKSKADCPVCEKGLGVPWGGWFLCDSCPAVALVGDGRVFMRVVIC